MLQEYSVTITTSAAQTATVYAGSRIVGTVQAIKYEPGTLDTGADLTITGETTGVPILTQANAGTSDIWYSPRTLASANTDGTAATDAFEEIWLFEERIKVAVAQGGASKAGTITFYVDEEQ